MSNEPIRFTVDGVVIAARAGQTIIAACDAGGVYIPRLCYRSDLPAGGQCRVCTVTANGRPSAACVTPVAQAMVVENATPALQAGRKTILEMLFVEGNHPCPFCEKSGSCDLQATGYRLEMYGTEFPYRSPKHEIDASHPDVFLDRNTCILCGLCVRASRAEGKAVFGFEGRGAATRLAINSFGGLAATNLDVTDAAAAVCPVGCIVVKKTGYETPYGEREFDAKPIGSEIERKNVPVRETRKLHG